MAQSRSDRGAGKQGCIWVCCEKKPSSLKLFLFFSSCVSLFSLQPTRPWLVYYPCCLCNTHTTCRERERGGEERLPEFSCSRYFLFFARWETDDCDTNFSRSELLKLEKKTSSSIRTQGRAHLNIIFFASSSGSHFIELFAFSLRRNLNFASRGEYFFRARTHKRTFGP